MVCHLQLPIAHGMATHSLGLASVATAQCLIHAHEERECWSLLAAAPSRSTSSSSSSSSSSGLVLFHLKQRKQRNPGTFFFLPESWTAQEPWSLVRQVVVALAAAFWCVLEGLVRHQGGPWNPWTFWSRADPGAIRSLVRLQNNGNQRKMVYPVLR